MENSPVSNQRGYKNLGSCNGYFKVGLLQLIAILNKSLPHSKTLESSKCCCLLPNSGRTALAANLGQDYFQCCYKCVQSLHGQAPQYISNLLSYDEKSRFTRSSGKGLLKIPKWNNETCGKTFSVAGPYEWNKVPFYIRQKDTLKDFKKELQTYLFRNSYQ